MSPPVLQVTVLIVAGVVAVVIGSLILLDPVAFHASAGIEVSDQIALRNELKSAGGTVLAFGLLALGATVFAGLRSIALTTSALIYGSYGAARVLSFFVDGVPNTTLMWNALIELVIAAACTLSIIRQARAHDEPTYQFDAA